MLVLGIDPSSTRTGYAVLASDGRIHAVGVLAGRSADDALARIRAVSDDIRGVIEEHTPDVIVLEVPSGKVGRRHGGGGAGLPVYGMAVGYILAVVEQAVELHRDVTVETVQENRWSASIRKIQRTAVLCSEFPDFAAVAQSE